MTLYFKFVQKNLALYTHAYTQTLFYFPNYRHWRMEAILQNSECWIKGGIDSNVSVAGRQLCRTKHPAI